MSKQNQCTQIISIKLLCNNYMHAGWTIKDLNSTVLVYTSCDNFQFLRCTTIIFNRLSPIANWTWH